MPCNVHTCTCPNTHHTQTTIVPSSQTIYTQLFIFSIIYLQTTFVGVVSNVHNFFQALQISPLCQVTAVGKNIPLPIFCPCEYILSVCWAYYKLYLSESNTEKPRCFNLGHMAAGYRHMIHGVKPKRINHKKDFSQCQKREDSVPKRQWIEEAWGGGDGLACLKPTLNLQNLALFPINSSAFSLTCAQNRQLWGSANSLAVKLDLLHII